MEKRIQSHSQHHPGWSHALFLLMLIWLASVTTTAGAQPAGISRIFVTGSNAATAPTIELYAYGTDAQGNNVDLSGHAFVVQHGDQVVTEVTVAGERQGATFTIVLLDITPGVARHGATLQQALQQYASPPTMVEQSDYVAIYRVEEVAAVPVLEATSFYNSVRNAFANPPPPNSGPTALYDSVMGLLNNMTALAPAPALAPALVIISDGTDAVSTQFRAGDVPVRAAALGIPVHTIWLDNERLSPALKSEGREYLAQVATGTGGVAVTLVDADSPQEIWNRIASFHRHTVLRYVVPELRGGEYPVVLSLRDNPAIQAQTTVQVSAGAPTVNIILPLESRNLTLTNLDEPVQLSFSTDVRWLDGVQRSLTRAQLLVNGILVQDIDVNRLDRFNASINNFTYGENRVQVAVVDEQGHRAVSPEVVLTINPGATTTIPPEVRPVGRLSRLPDLPSQLGRFWPVLVGCFFVLFILVMMSLLLLVIRRFPILQRLGLQSFLRRLPFLRPYMGEAAQVQQVGQKARHMKGQMGRYAPDVQGQRHGKAAMAMAGRPPAFLEVLESVSRMPSPRIELDQPELRIGRSPAQAEIAFENDITVSRIHASIVKEGDDYRIYDEQSTSGAFINEQRVPEYGLQLVDGDEIRLGAVRLRFRQP
jgi:hypothetical protein